MRLIKRGSSIIDLVVRAGVTETLSLRISKGITLNDASTATLDTMSDQGVMVGRLAGLIDTDSGKVIFYLPENFSIVGKGKRYRVRIKSPDIIDVMTGSVISEY